MPVRILHVVRHGKALPDDRSIRDDDRPLLEKGIVNSVAAARRLHAQYAAPGLIISSHAARALHTAHIFARVMGYPHGRVQVNEKLYADGENEAYRILESLPDDLESVMIVGHNPDVTYVAGTCAGQNISSIPASGIVTVRFEADRWREIEKAKTKYTVIDY
ncbi:MAG: histidine phosphatase family protein [Bacteroidales bacterium]|jgi:phosphohistidine phosphatase|nr:histidine phosphatase family protein [Bacteroidales bacterium]